MTTLFTPGPTEMEADIREIGSRPLSYFRSPDYCQEIAGLTQDLAYLFQTRTVPLTITASGTAGMEMALVNLFNPGEKVVYVNAGTFGAKWGDMARGLGLEAVEFAIPHGQDPDLEALRQTVGTGSRGVLLTGHETSTGYGFDIQAICAALADRDCLIVVDGVSAIGADPFAMDDWGVDCAIVSSQKALACMPGLVFVALSERAQARLHQTRHYRSYLDARIYLDNIGRGMLPFTPAMHATYQVAERLRRIRALGLSNHLAGIAARAKAFRMAMLAGGDGFRIFPARCSNALSAISLPRHVRASELVRRLREGHDAILPMNPTGAEDFVRVSHMGALSRGDLVALAGWIREEADG